jgi:hypothetical protein
MGLWDERNVRTRDGLQRESVCSAGHDTPISAINETYGFTNCEKKAKKANMCSVRSNPRSTWPPHTHPPPNNENSQRQYQQQQEQQNKNNNMNKKNNKNNKKNNKDNKDNKDNNNNNTNDNNIKRKHHGLKSARKIAHKATPNHHPPC